MSETVAPEAMQPSAGALLRHAREGAGLHVAALAGALKVPQRQIEALEQDQLEQLPDVVYARALAASISRNLGLDPQQVLARLPKGGDSRLGKGEPINVPFRAPGDSGTSAWRNLLARPPVMAALALMFGAAILLLLPLIPNPVEPTTAPAASLAVDAPANEAPAGVAAPAPGGMVTESVQPPIVPVPAEAAPGVPPAAPLAPLAPPVPQAAAPAPQAAAEASVAAPAAVDAATAPVIEFRTAQPSWVQVTDSRGSVYLRRMLAAGETVGVSGATPLAVVIGSASGTQVQVRGKPFAITPYVRDNVARFEVR